MRALALLGWLLFLACAPPADYLPRPAGARIQVRSAFWSDVVVYATDGVGPRVRLGMVAALGSADLRIPEHLMGRRVSFVLDPVGSQVVYVTDGVGVRAGQRVELSIAHTITQSFVSVWG